MANKKLKLSNYSIVFNEQVIVFYNNEYEYKIYDYPLYFKDLINHFVEPKSKLEVFGLLHQTNKGIKKKDFLLIIERLEKYRILIPHHNEEITAAPSKKYSIGIINTNGIGYQLQNSLTKTSKYVIPYLDISEIKNITQPNYVFEKNFSDLFKNCKTIIFDCNFSLYSIKVIEDYCLQNNKQLVVVNASDTFAVITLLGFKEAALCFNCFIEAANYKHDFKENTNFSYKSCKNLCIINSISAFLYSLIENNFQENNFFYTFFSIDIYSNIEKLLITNGGNCKSCTHTLANNIIQLPKIYEHSRKSDSLNSLILDKFLLNYLSGRNNNKILDIGCGIGSLSIPLAENGNNVTAIDISHEMISSLQKNITPNLRSRIKIVNGDFLDITLKSKFDIILCNLILDHINNPILFLRKCNDNLKKNGKLIIVLPHPFKDSGYWVKNEIVSRDEVFFVKNYFMEGKIIKSRFNLNGTKVLNKITSFKRNLGTYSSLLNDAGFNISRIFEPQLMNNQSLEYLQCKRCTMLPYFLILDSRKIS